MKTTNGGMQLVRPMDLINEWFEEGGGERDCLEWDR